MGAMTRRDSGYVSQGASQVREMTRDHEGTAVLVALAAGFGVGLLIGAALSPSHRTAELERSTGGRRNRAPPAGARRKHDSRSARRADRPIAKVSAAA